MTGRRSRTAATESDLEEYKEKEVEEDGGLGGGDVHAGELSLDTPRPEDPRYTVPRGMLWRHVRPLVAPGGERMRCNRLPLESCVILGGGRGSWQDVGRLCARVKTMS